MQTTPNAIYGLWITTATLLHVLGFVAVALHCLKSRREMASTLVWIFLAWSIPVLGLLLYLSFGINRVSEKAWKRQQANDDFLSARRAKEDQNMPLAYWRAVHEGVVQAPPDGRNRDLHRTMDSILPEWPLLGGNSVSPLVSGDETYPKMLKAIREAKYHVHLQAFIIGNDAVGRQFLDALRDCARRGVQVRVLYDRFGSTVAWATGLFNRYRKEDRMKLVGWTQANPIKRQFQINLRNHRKLLIVDGRSAFTGGINLQRHNTTRNGNPPIRDYHFEIQGPVVQELQYSFLRDWYFMTDDDPDSLLTEETFPHIDPCGDALVRVVNGGPSSNTEVMTDLICSALSQAQNQILLVTPYFVPPPDILRALRLAALRGVDVQIIVPLDTNHRFVGFASQALYEPLLEAGIKIYERGPPFMHAKALLVDDAFALVGSANMDMRSLRLNYETNIAIFSEPFVDAMKRIVFEDKSMSRAVELQTWRTRPTRRRIAENVCSLLTPVL